MVQTWVGEWKVLAPGKPFLSLGLRLACLRGESNDLSEQDRTRLFYTIPRLLESQERTLPHSQLVAIAFLESKATTRRRIRRQYACAWLTPVHIPGPCR